MKNKKPSKPKDFPSGKLLKEARRKYSRGMASRPLGSNATQVEKLKHSICREFVTYSNTHGLTNRDMAKKLGVAESLMSKMLHYRYDEFTLDRLFAYLSKFFNEVEVTIRIA